MNQAQKFSKANLKSQFCVVRRKGERSPESHHRRQGHLHVARAAVGRAREGSVQRLREQQHDVVARSFFGEFTGRTFGQSDLECTQPLCWGVF